MLTRLMLKNLTVFSAVDFEFSSGLTQVAQLVVGRPRFPRES